MSDRFERDVERILSAGNERASATARQELAARRRAVLDAVQAHQRQSWTAHQAGCAADVFRNDWRAWWRPAGAIAAALLMLRPETGTMPAVAASSDAIDMEVLLADENLALYDDLEFSEWLAVVDDETG